MVIRKPEFFLCESGTLSLLREKRAEVRYPLLRESNSVNKVVIHHLFVSSELPWLPNTIIMNMLNPTLANAKI